ncbi:MAG: coproporphyrinogen dehydrogenase HemZ [Clostridia bacterium]|nr:coproporphyrinogen dehydrogenase HemZ [Clostridia bacterium]
MKRGTIRLYKISVPTEKSKYHLSELANMFLPSDQVEFSTDIQAKDFADLIIGSQILDYNIQKRLLYKYLKGCTGKDLDWGILTGVRPIKLLAEMLENHTEPEAKSILKNHFLISEKKVDLMLQILKTQIKVLCDKSRSAIGIYVGIPFCPTRCSYCSFTSNKISEKGAKDYLLAIFKEMKAVRNSLNDLGWYAESIYIGGGTPTSLCESDFESLLKEVSSCFFTEKTKEFTVECGRPDTINKVKLDSILKYGAKRISINPQSMKQKTMELIGRSHSPQEIKDAFVLAKEMGIPIINSDLIAGLPEESPADFKASLEEILALEPHNITVHTLAIKKASKLIGQDENFAFKQAAVVGEMLTMASDRLSEAGYRPYYLYRQKHMAGNFENVGYALPGTESLYNIRIMAENQSIIALGAGAISKIYYPQENRLERIANVSNVQIYIDRIEEMIDRKEKGIIC